MPNVVSPDTTSPVDAFKAANLRQRVITALIIAVAFLALVLFSSPLWFAIVAGAIFLIAAWEWSDLAGLPSVFARLSLLVVVIALMVFLVMQGAQVFLQTMNKWLMLSVTFWLVMIGMLVTYPASDKLLNHSTINALVGVLVLIPAWLGMVFLKQQQPNGLLILMVIAIIALADIGAYFAGVSFGKHKLAPKVSPGKSWEGVAGGMLCNSLFALVLSCYWHLSLQKSVLLALVMLVTTVASIVGDLFESMIKRHRGVKDSGTLLPGHGGILDRIDGWTAAVPVFTLAYVYGVVMV